MPILQKHIKIKLCVFTAIIAVIHLGFIPANAQTSSTLPTPELLGPGITVDTLSPSTSLLLMGSTENEKSRYGNYERALILETDSQYIKSDSGAKQVTIYKLELLSGSQKKSQQTTTIDPSSLPFGFSPQIGDIVIAYVQPNINGPGFSIFLENYDRSNAYIWIALTLLILLIFLAGFKGVKIFIISLLPLFLLLEIILPLYTRKYPVAFIIVFFAIIYSATLSLLTQGLNKKTLVNIIATTLGSIITFLSINIFINLAKLNTYNHSLILNLIKDNPWLENKSIIVIGLMLIATGIIYDITTSITTGIAELKLANLANNFKKIFISSIDIGREHLLSMAPIISAAYLASAFIFFIDVKISQNPFIKNINQDNISQAILLPLSGSIGIVISIFCTSAISALFWNRYSRSTDPLKRATGWRNNDSVTHVEDSNK